MRRLFFFFGGLFGALGVVLGAFAAHTLKGRLTPELLATFETGVKYQTYHALALLIVALVPARRYASTLLTVSGWLFVVGTLLFSGSLYLLTLGGMDGSVLLHRLVEWPLSLVGSVWWWRHFGTAGKTMGILPHLSPPRTPPEWGYDPRASQTSGAPGQSMPVETSGPRPL
jgi:uncharacterized membrane protein YgdD (TMEM256/DUF423 family)